MDQQTYWNNAAPVKQFTTPFQMALFRNYVSTSAYILDIGCGYGRVLKELYDNGYINSVGIDFSGKMIERGKAMYPHLCFETMANGIIRYPENTFDAVILLAVLTCIAEDKEQTELLRNIKKLLKPDGILYVNDFLLNNDERNKKRYGEYEAKYKKYGVFELPEGALVRHHSTSWVKKSLKPFKELEFGETEYIVMLLDKDK